MFSVGSLFAGIGGIDLGLERTGEFKTRWFCERDSYCQKVLAKHWPGVPIFNDVHDIDDQTPAVEVLTAGFPCQPVSHAGRRKAQNDDRWLWPEVGRCIRVLRPAGVLLENVPGLFTAGFDDVVSDLAACGYNAEWDCIPAASVGAPHLRDRVFIIATPRSEFGRDLADSDNARPRDQVRAGWDAPWHGGSNVADANLKRCDRRSGGQKAGREQFADGTCPNGIWATEPNVGRVANGVPNRVDRLRALGNAVVPQVAEHLGRQMLRIMGETA